MRKNKVSDILGASHISTAIASDGLSPVANFVAELANDIGPTSKTAHIAQSLIKGKTYYEQAADLPNRSVVTKEFHFEFTGTAEEFDKGIGVTCSVIPSTDGETDAKLLLLKSTMIEKVCSTPFSVSLQIHGQQTNTEFLYSKQIGMSIGRQACEDDQDGKSSDFISAIISGNTPFSMRVDTPIYDRKSNPNLKELDNWIGFDLNHLDRDILDVQEAKDICIIRHSVDEPSPIVMVLDNSRDMGQIGEFEAQQCKHDGQDGCILRLSNVKWALAHIKMAHDVAPFTNFDEVKATIKPMSKSGTWSDTPLTKGARGILDEINGITRNGQRIQVMAIVRNTYVVCNNVPVDLADDPDNFDS